MLYMFTSFQRHLVPLGLPAPPRGRRGGRGPVRRQMACASCWHGSVALLWGSSTAETYCGAELDGGI